jgi:hypothetical protein
MYVRYVGGGVGHYQVEVDDEADPPQVPAYLIHMPDEALDLGPVVAVAGGSAQAAMDSEVGDNGEGSSDEGEGEGEGDDDAGWDSTYSSDGEEREGDPAPPDGEAAPPGNDADDDDDDLGVEDGEGFDEDEDEEGYAPL